MNKTILSTFLVVAMLITASGLAYAQNGAGTGAGNGTGNGTGVYNGVMQLTYADDASSYTTIDELKAKELAYEAMSPKDIVEALNAFLKQDNLDIKVTDYEELLGNSRCKGLIGTALNKVYQIGLTDPTSTYYNMILEKAATVLIFLGQRDLKSDKRAERLTALTTETIELSDQEQNLKSKFYYEQAANYANISIIERAYPNYDVVAEGVVQKMLQKTSIGTSELNLMFNEYLNIPMKIIVNYIQNESPSTFIKVLVLRKYLEIASSLVNEVKTKNIKEYTFDERFVGRKFFEQGNLSQVDISVAARLKEEISDPTSMSKLDLFKKLTDKIAENVITKSWVEEAYGPEWRTQRDAINSMELKPCW